MGIKVVPYQEELIPAVKDFNGRLSRGGVAFRFPESPVPGCLPKVDGRETYQEYFVALESGCVRGGYILKHQPFWLGDKARHVGNLQLPISEGAVPLG